MKNMLKLSNALQLMGFGRNFYRGIYILLTRVRSLWPTEFAKFRSWNFQIYTLCAAQSSCEQPVTNNYYTNSNNTTSNHYYGSSPITGAPSISPDFINKMLCTYGNPQTCGTGQALYQDGQTYNIDPAFALAFFWHESNFGTKGETVDSKSLGNLRCIEQEESCTDGYAWFHTWEDGYNAWYSLIANLYIKQWGLSTVNQIIPKYAPSSDGNNEQAYISNVVSLINTWRSGNATIPTE